MRRTIFASNQAAPIVIIQGAYEKFCAPSSAVTTYGSQQLFENIFTSGEPGPLATTHEDWLKFQGLVAAWRQQCGAMSSTTEAVMCPAYQGIIGMGPTAVPFILKQLESEGDDPDQWFWALTAITGATPENPEDSGNYVRMAASWFDWAKNSGYAW